MLKTVIRIPNHLGDAIMAQGAIRAFSEMSPDCDITLLLPEYTIPLFDNLPYLKFLPLSKNQLHGTGAILKQIKMLAPQKFACGIVLTPSLSSALILTISGIQSRYGFDGEGRGILLNNKVPLAEVKRKHRSQRYHHLLERVAGHKFDSKEPLLEYDHDALSAANQILVENEIDQERHYIVIAPQAVAESRRWGSGNYGALAERIINEMNLQVVLIGTSQEFEAGEEIKAGNEHIINLCGKTDIPNAGAIMSMASVFVGNDSGLAHLAAAVQVPLVVLSGADNPLETSPISKKKQVIVKDELECISCVKNRCPLKGDRHMQCMKQISVLSVSEAVKDKIVDN